MKYVGLKKVQNDLGAKAMLFASFSWTDGVLKQNQPTKRLCKFTDAGETAIVLGNCFAMC